ncbi:hypothetical protein BpHYR1_008783 [Brachionus plicatilis]|uniref:Uncharacterized protein n=1 Tax=Brachionus plicatilis TaxID=10195 RepID=A0A3M7SCS2_BRAPC|nr:hypothetical protein BpHYR1_008783 [Brachionus plicatilis]
MKQFGIICPAMTTEVKLCFYKTYVRPILQYGMDNIVLNNEQCRSIQTLESRLIKAMFMVSNKMTRSTKLVLACNIDNEINTRIKIKINFGKRLVSLQSTRKLIQAIEKNDKLARMDKKNFFYEIGFLTNNVDNTFEGMINSGLNMVYEARARNRTERAKQEVRQVIDALKLIGPKRTEMLKKLLKIEL